MMHSNQYTPASHSADEVVPQVVFTKSPDRGALDESTRMVYCDGFRLTAILAVVFSHLMRFCTPKFGSVFVAIGDWGVACFFILSGYLLSRPFLTAAIESREWPDIKKYAARRFYRIWPMYAFAVFFGGAFAAISRTKPVSAMNIACHLFFLQNIYPEFEVAPEQLGPLWTMPIDVAFYILLPLLAYPAYIVLSRFQISRRIRLTLVGLSAIAITSLFYRIMVDRPFTHETIPITYFFAVSRSIFGMGTTFAVGAIIGLAEYAGVRIKHHLALLALMFFGIISFAMMIKLHDTSTALYRSDYIDLLGALSSGFIFIALINCGTLRFYRWFLNCNISHFAALSYGIYLFHYPIAKFLYDTMNPKSDIELLVFLVAATVTTYFAALSAHHLIELPFLRKKNKLREVQVSLIR
jgi:peptidoglycan/LPS O-acetylase OafA/YrhL